MKNFTLLENAKPEKVEDLLHDPNFVLQQKLDGKRLIAQRTADGEVAAYSRSGASVILPPTPGGGEWVVDGELLSDGTFIAFDCLQAGSEDVSNRFLWKRLVALREIYKGPIIQTIWTEKMKTRAFKILQSQGAEGAVFKDIWRGRMKGRHEANGYKVKFVQTVNVLAGALNGDKQSCHVSVRNGKDVEIVGKCKIPLELVGNQEGKILEVRYLYATPRLTQPVFIRVRDDVSEPDQISTLKRKVI